MKLEEENKTNQEKLIEKPIAFKDFKNSISVEEFEAILFVVRKEYNQLESILSRKTSFDDKADQGIKQLEAQRDMLPKGLADKLIEGVKRKYKGEIKTLYSEEIVRQKQVTDFLNRFQHSDDILPYLDFTFINTETKKEE